MADIRIKREGAGLYCLVIVTDAAAAWVETHVQAEPWQWLGDMLVVEGSDRALDIMRGARGAGFSVEV